MAVDLHTHSNRSDGTETPSAVIDLAADAHLSAVALTDHDVLEGLPEARERAWDRGIRLVPGVELSVEWASGRMHMLAYWIEGGPLADRLEWLRGGRDRRNTEIILALQAEGYDITEEEVRAEATGSSIGRPHIATVLMNKGIVDSVAEAFDRFLGTGRSAYRERPRLQAAEAVDLAHRSGGVAAVAHPHTVADDAAGFSAAFEAFAEMGIDGVECYYVEYARDRRSRLLTIARSVGLIPTGGSDFHGSRKPGISVGSGKGDLVVPDMALEELDAARARTV